jgi:hypothetical protein
MERNSSLVRHIAPGHGSASDTPLFEKPSPGERAAPLDLDGSNLAWSTIECQGHSLTAGRVNNGLAEFGLPGTPSPGTVQATTSAMGSLNQELATIDTQTPNKPRKPRRPKPRINLAPDQPPTTQGKPRARVYVACLQWYICALWFLPCAKQEL